MHWWLNLDQSSKFALVVSKKVVTICALFDKGMYSTYTNVSDSQVIISSSANANWG